jgi:hypothetical protein
MLREQAHGTHLTGDSVYPRALDASEERKISCCYWDSNHISSAVQPVAKSLFHYTMLTKILIKVLDVLP